MNGKRAPKPREAASQDMLRASSPETGLTIARARATITSQDMLRASSPETTILAAAQWDGYFRRKTCSGPRVLRRVWLRQLRNAYRSRPVPTRDDRMTQKCSLLRQCASRRARMSAMSSSELMRVTMASARLATSAERFRPA